MAMSGCLVVCTMYDMGLFSNSTLLIAAKAPIPGQVKTRLLSRYKPAQAAMLHWRFLVAVAERALSWPFSRRLLFYTPEVELSAFQRFAVDYELIAQPEGNLGDRLACGFDRSFVDGARVTAAIGADSPHLPDALVREALDALNRSDLAMIPVEDGGYSFIAMRAANRSVFEGIEWEGADVFGQTIAKARSSGLRVWNGPVQYDVDRPEDVDRLRTDLRSASQPTLRRLRDEVEAISAEAEAGGGCADGDDRSAAVRLQGSHR